MIAIFFFFFLRYMYLFKDREGGESERQHAHTEGVGGVKREGERESPADLRPSTRLLGLISRPMSSHTELKPRVDYLPD